MDEQVAKDLQIIKECEPSAYEAMKMVINHVAGTYQDKYAEGIKKGIDTKHMLYDEEGGMYINIYQIERYLQRYITKGSSKSFLLRDILKAIHYLVFEVTRRIVTNQLDNTEPKV